jgi:hypothetical protein
LVDGSSGSCCPDLRKPSIYKLFIIAWNSLFIIYSFVSLL